MINQNMNKLMKVLQQGKLIQYSWIIHCFCCSFFYSLNDKQQTNELLEEEKIGKKSKRKYSKSLNIALKISISN